MVPLVLLRMWSECLESGSNDADYDVTLAPLDIKDAFLQVPQEEIVGVSLYGKELVIKRNLPLSQMHLLWDTQRLHDPRG